MRTHRLLVVDDDESVAGLVATVARAAGYEVRIAATAAEVWADEGNPPSVVLVDLQMAGTDGLAVLRELAAHSSPARIHVFSGTGSTLLRSATRLAEQLGLRVGEPIAKPVELADLQHLLAAAREPRPTPDTMPSAAAPTVDVPPGEFSPGELRKGIENGELFVVFQPIVDLATLEPVGAETLVRWNHPAHGIIPPLRFVPLAEETGLASEMTDEILLQALRFAGTAGAALRTVSVNVGPAALADRKLPDRIAKRLAATGVGPGRLVIEVTESMVDASRVDALEVLNRLRLRGCELSIDDFGTGSSSLARLEQLPCSELKIERAFVSQVTRRKEAETIVRSTIELASQLGLRTVAEGIEEPQVLDWLRNAGCEWGQGFLFSKGLQAKAFGEWLADWPARRAIV